MPKLDLVPDVGAPAVVAGVNIMVAGSTSQIFSQNVQDVAAYGMAIGGYLGGHMGWGGANVAQFLKNVGIAAAPLAMEKLYHALKGEVVPAQARVMRRVSRYPAPANETNFQGVRLSRRVGSGILV